MIHHLTLCKTRQIIDAFMAMEDNIQARIFSHYENPLKDQLCKCGRGHRVVKCRWDGCFQYPTSCAWCYVDYHRYNPFHWALVWDVEKGFWVKHDYSEVTTEADTCINLCHMDEDKGCPWSSSSLPFQVTHTNGIHSLRVRFCECPEIAPSRVDQLLSVQLFPYTPTDPQSAFTFAILKQFRMHNYQSKCGAYDFITSIRRFTNNVHTETEAPVSNYI